MAVLPAAAAAAYQAAAAFSPSAAAGAGASTGAAGASGASGSFGDFLNNAIKDSVSTMRQGETMAAKQVTGQADIVEVVNAVNAAEMTLDTVVAVRDKVIQAYQSIMNMPI
jgi:flagellar hook-basal body complex protein FliE